MRQHGTLATGVTLYLRPPVAGLHSIERVVRTIEEHLPHDIARQVVTLRRPARGVLGRLRALAEVATRSGGVHHVTGDVHFLVLVLPWSRTVLTIHDLGRLHELRGLRRWLYGLLWFRIPTRLAAVVTVISEQTREELCEVLPRLSGSIQVIPNPLPVGLSPATLPARSRSRPVILHVGTMANKNLELSTQVVAGLGAELVVLGLLSPEQESTLAASGLTFRSLHDIPDEAVGDVYRSSDLLLFPSFAEGFGMPIIEAQACGIPVVTSDREPMRSVAGGAALLIDPFDHSAALEAVKRILDDCGLREELRRNGLANVERFRPSAVAAAYGAVYRSITTAEAV
jgi:glycosyltransferase involved in cell wall biosynthesis